MVPSFKDTRTLDEYFIMGRTKWPDLSELKDLRLDLAEAGIDPASIDYIGAHGTSTPLNDAAETAAIKEVFGDRAYRVPVSSQKSMFGHAIGATSAMEAAVTALTVKHGVITPTINYEEPDPVCDLDYVPNQARESPVRYALSNAFGFGGHNCCKGVSS